MLEQAGDIAAPPQHTQIFTGVTQLDSLGLAVVAAHGASGRGAQGGGDVVADFVGPIVADRGHATS